MSIAKVIKVISNSPTSAEDAIQQALATVSKTVHNISGLKVVDWSVNVENNKVTAHKVTLEVAFAVEE